VVNHCIRKITPEGVVSTFAGRPQKSGYSDGALRDAQFNNPRGIIYDQASGTFYVADQANRRIRTISTE
jgi:DNA-binding beta-propeller fold protein YncE